MQVVVKREINYQTQDGNNVKSVSVSDARPGISLTESHHDAVGPPTRHHSLEPRAVRSSLERSDINRY